MKPVLRIDGSQASALEGRPVFDSKKALWNGGMLGAALVFAPLTFRWHAVLLCGILTWLSLLV